MNADLTPREAVTRALFSTTCYEQLSAVDRAIIDRAVTAVLTALADIGITVKEKP